MTNLCLLWALFSIKHKFYTIFIVIFSIIAACLEALGIGLIFPVIKILTTSKEEIEDIYRFLPMFISNNVNPTTVIFYLCALFLFKNVLLSIFTFIFNRYAALIRNDLSVRLYKQYIFADYIFHVENNSSKLLRNLTNNITLFNDRFFIPLILVFCEIFILVFLISLALFLEPIGSAIILGSIISFSVLYYVLFKQKLHLKGVIAQENEQKRIQFSQEIFSGIKEIKVFKAYKNFIQSYSAADKFIALANADRMSILLCSKYWLESVLLLSFLFFLYFQISSGYQLFELLPIIAFYALVAFRAIPSLNKILQGVQDLKFSYSLITNLLNSFFDIKNKNKNKNSPNRKIQFSKTINLKNIYFKFPNANNFILKNLSLSINKGDRIGIKGFSGSGKTTLLNLILGLIKPDQGHILIDNKKHLDLEALQGSIGYVPQDSFLLDDTIENNILFGIKKSRKNDLRILKVLKDVELIGLVKSLDKGIHSYVGERGVKLSGGQRQRLSIARCLFHNSNFLVFDEATSALDNETEKEVIQCIYNLSKSITIIMVAHRISTLGACNKIFSLKSGKLTKIS